MKKVITLVIVSVLVMSAKAQFQKGNKVLGFGFGFNSSMQEQSFNPGERVVKTTGLNLSAELGFAKNESRLNGFYLNAGYGVSTTEFSSQPSSISKNKNVNLGAGYFTRRYVMLGNRFYIFGEGRAGVFYGSDFFAKLNDPYRQSFGASVSINPGLAYKIKDRFLLELRFADLANISYTQQETETGFNNKNVGRNFNIGTSLGLGYLNNIGIGARWIIK